MFKEFEDFEFDGKKFSELSNKYISVCFEDEMDISFGLERDMESGETNKYRREPNYFGDNYTDTLPLELHIIKDPCVYSGRPERAFSQRDIREITRWLTSPHYPEWIVFTLPLKSVDDDATHYCGYFNNVEPFTVGGSIMGLKLHFKCTTPFGFTDIITNTESVVTYKSVIVENNSDEIKDYYYPTISIIPHDNGSIFICNLSDCNELDSGTLVDNFFSSLIQKAQDYATLHGYDITFTGTGAQNIVPICNNTAVQFYLTDIHTGEEKKCTAFYRTDTKAYKIVDSGFLYMSMYKDLDIEMNCQFLTINDSIGRMVTYDKLGITDVGHIYWPRLLNGNNNILLFGNADFEIQHQESRKVGES